MKTLKWSLLVVFVTGLGVSTVMLLTRSPRPLAAEASEPNQAVERDQPEVYQPAASATVPVCKLAPALPPIQIKQTCLRRTLRRSPPR